METGRVVVVWVEVLPEVVEAVDLVVNGNNGEVGIRVVGMVNGESRVFSEFFDVGGCDIGQAE